MNAVTTRPESDKTPAKTSRMRHAPAIIIPMKTVITAEKLWDGAQSHDNPLVVIEDGNISFDCHPRIGRRTDRCARPRLPRCNTRLRVLRRAYPRRGRSRRHGSHATRTRRRKPLPCCTWHRHLPRHHGNRSARCDSPCRSRRLLKSSRSPQLQAAPGHWAFTLKARFSPMKNVVCSPPSICSHPTSAPLTACSTPPKATLA